MPGIPHLFKHMIQCRSKMWFILVCLLIQGCAATTTNKQVQEKEATVEELVEAGNALIAEGAYEPAIIQFNRALAKDIASADAHGNMSVALYYLSRYDEAVREAQQAIVMAPTEINWRFNLGAAYTRKNDNERAISAYQGAVDLARRYRDEERMLLRNALIGLGRACEIARDYPRALDAYREALVFAPEDVELLAGVGNIYFRQKQYEEAETTYEQALALDATHPMSNYNLGLVYARTGRFDQAIALFTETSDLPEGMAGNITGNSLTTADRSRSARIAAFRSQLNQMSGAPRPSRSGKAPPYTYALGMTYYEQGDDEAAIEAFNRALQDDDSLAEAHLYIGNIHVRQGRVDEAITKYNEAISINPEFMEAYNNMGSLHAEQGNVAEAVDAYQQALKLNPKFYDARTNLGLIYAEAGRYEEAIEAYEMVIKADAGIAEAHNNLGTVYLNQGKLEEAIIECKKAIRLQRDFPEAYNNLGLAQGYQVYFDDLVDDWRSIAGEWTGEDIKIGKDLQPVKKTDWLLLRRVPAQSSSVGGQARARYREGVEYAVRGQFDAALQKFQSALAAQPGWHAAHLAIGSVHLAQEHWQTAANALMEAAELNEEDPLTYASLAIAQVMDGEYGKASNTWKQVAKLSDDSMRPMTKASLDLLREKQKQADEAIKSFKKAIEYNPDFTKALFNLGTFYDQIHKYPEAVEAYEQVARLEPNVPIIHFRLGVGYNRVGRTENAQEAIRTYISMVVDPMLLPQVETFLKHMK